MRVVFGGSFNPPTIAHKEIIKKLSSMYDEVIIVPNGANYDRKSLDIYEHRINMIKILTNDFSNVTISDIEQTREFVGTYQTLRDLNHPVFAFGDDWIESFKGWKNSQVLLEENNFIVFTRDKTVDEIKEIIQNDSFLKDYKDKFEVIKIDFPDVSSSIFRKNLDKNIVTEEIYDYIIKNNIYKEEL